MRSDLAPFLEGFFFINDIHPGYKSAEKYQFVLYPMVFILSKQGISAFGRTQS